MVSSQLLLTNDDGIGSPGLWAAARALSELGFVNVVAPREQYSGAGRSLPIYSDGLIDQQKMQVDGKDWNVYAVGGTPAQAVLHAIFEILPEKDLIKLREIRVKQMDPKAVSKIETVRNLDYVTMQIFNLVKDELNNLRKKELPLSIVKILSTGTDSS